MGKHEDFKFSTPRTRSLDASFSNVLVYSTLPTIDINDSVMPRHPPAEINSFYLQPMKTPTTSRWYTSRPLGHNTITKTMTRLCAAAGIGGFKTNHSLRATAATRLYQSGVDEQLVMERTGHRSLEGVRTYKRTSSEQREALSDILNRKHPRIDKTSTSEGDSRPQQSAVPDIVAPSTHQSFDLDAVIDSSPSQVLDGQ